MLLKFFFEFWCKFLGEFGVDDFFAGFDKFGFSFVFARFFIVATLLLNNRCIYYLF